MGQGLKTKSNDPQRRLAVRPVGLLILIGALLQGQAGPSPNAARVGFEVASVKPNHSGQLGMPSRTNGRMYSATNIALRRVIAAAYGVPVDRVLGGPSWLGSDSNDMRLVGGERFDIAATLPEGTSARQLPTMLRILLAERFRLIAHIESRKAPVYALLLARSDGRLGSQLRKSSFDCEAAATDAPKPDATFVMPATPVNPEKCQTELGGQILGRGQRLTSLARMLSLVVGRLVVDRTGLTGGYDFELSFPELTTPTNLAANSPDPVTGVFSALRDQLGLRLENDRADLDFVIIDRVERPTEN